MHTVGQISTAQLPNFSAVVFCLFGSCFLTFRQLCFAESAVVFWSFGSWIVRQLFFFSGSAVVFCLLGSCFVLPDGHSRSKFNCPTALFFGSCVLLVRQLSFDFSAVVFCWIGSCFLIVRQLCFDRSAVVFCRFSSCLLPARQLFCAARCTQ